ncbi:ArdC family protein [Vibrio rotiferianus]|uniref:ArdC family protein n=1 Tax=Vibrio rotiferianus TaxID=190895 RepID=UPI0005EE4783|nr:zincin-like metallopeptidase domain-containing protein [Vibrio rotiferianus]
MKNSACRKAKDFHQEITNQIIEALENGVKPWTCPWDVSCGSGIPVNYLTKEPYKGMNILLLWSKAMEKKYSSNCWLGFGQAKKLGGHVRLGEKGTHITFYSMVEKDAENEEGKEVFPIMKTHTVFNLDQIEGIDVETVDVPNEPLSRIESADRFIEATGAVIEHRGENAFYSPSSDVIVLPDTRRFSCADDLYATSFHEIVHWTSHKSRLDRKLKGKFGDKDYAFEELVAELGSAFLTAEFGISGDVQHESYIADWLSVLKNDKRFIFKAASLASKAHLYLLDISTSKSNLAA